jgi:hypothetical protein
MPITVSHAKSNTIADWSGTVTVANSTGGSTTAAASDLVRPVDWNSGHVISEVKIGYFEPFIPANTNSSLSAPGIGTWYLDPFILPFALGSGQLNILNADAAGFKNGVVFSSSSGSGSRVQTLNNQLALYQLGTGASTTLLSRIWSADCSFLATQSNSCNGGAVSVTVSNYLSLSFPAQWDASGGVTYSSTAQSGTSSIAATTMASTGADNLITGAVAYLSGSRKDIFAFATSLSAGLYWLGQMFTSTSSTAGTRYTAGTMWSTQSRVHMLEFVGQAYKQLGKSVSDTSTVFEQFHGSVATTSSTPFLTLGTSDIRNLLTNARVYWNYAQSTY